MLGRWEVGVIGVRGACAGRVRACEGAGACVGRVRACIGSWGGRRAWGVRGACVGRVWGQ